MAFPYAFILSRLHFGKVMPSNTRGSPSSPPQTGGKVGNLAQPSDAKCLAGCFRASLWLAQGLLDSVPCSNRRRSVSEAFPSLPIVPDCFGFVGQFSCCTFCSPSALRFPDSFLLNNSLAVLEENCRTIFGLSDCCTSSRSCIRSSPIALSCRLDVRFVPLSLA